jgi:hypothetical protein
MVEQQTINGKEIWIKVDVHHVQRENANIIPTEYFTVCYFTEEPLDSKKGELILDENGQPKLFESPVAAITHASKVVEGIYSAIL